MEAIYKIDKYKIPVLGIFRNWRFGKSLFGR
jgi:hypothetical protein